MGDNSHRERGIPVKPKAHVLYFKPEPHLHGSGLKYKTCCLHIDENARYYAKK